MEAEYSSSGCESGWTIYFEQSRSGRRYVEYDQADEYCVNPRSEEQLEEDEEEGLSMVSDASSGPAAQVSQDLNNTNANCYDTDHGGVSSFYPVSTSNDHDGALVRNKQKQIKRMSTKKAAARPCEKRLDFYQDHMLDDTASSRPELNYSSMNYDDDDQSALSMRKMMDFSVQDHFSTSHFQLGGANSSSAMHTDHQYNQQRLHFHQQYNW